MPLVADITVLVVAYNHRKFVADCLQSIARQTVKPARVLVADDASPDGTADTIARILESDPESFGRFELQPNSSNIGLNATLNRLLDQVSTKYVTFISADDLMLPQRLEQQVSLMDRDGALLSYSDAKVIDRRGKVVHESSTLEFPWPDEPDRTERTFELLLETNWIPAASIMLRTFEFKRLGGYHPELYFEDLELLTRMAKVTKFSYSSDPLVAVRRLEDSLGTQTFTAENPEFLIATAEILELFEGTRLEERALSKRWELAKRVSRCSEEKLRPVALLWKARRGARSRVTATWHILRACVRALRRT